MIPIKKLLARDPAPPASDARGMEYFCTAVEHAVGSSSYAELTYYDMKKSKILCRIFIDKEANIKKWTCHGDKLTEQDFVYALTGNICCRNYLSNIGYTCEALAIASEYIGDTVPGGSPHDMFDRIDDNRRTRAWIKKQKKEKDLREEYFSLIPEYVMNEERESYIRRIFVSERFLFRWNEKRRDPITQLPYKEQVGFCAVCGERMCLDGSYTHNERTCCPECGTTVTVKDINRRHRNLQRQGCFMVLHRLRGDCVMLCSFICRIDCSGISVDNLHLPEIRICEQTRHIFDPERGIYHRYENRSVFDRSCGGYTSEWRRATTDFKGSSTYAEGCVAGGGYWYYSPDVAEHRRFNGMWFMVDDSRAALTETKLRYIDWSDVLSHVVKDAVNYGGIMNLQRLWLWGFLKDYLSYPVYEIFAKNKAYSLFGEDPRYLEQYGINPTGKTAEEVFGLPPKKARIILQANVSGANYKATVKFFNKYPDASAELIAALSEFIARKDNNYMRLKHLKLLPVKAKEYGYDMSIYRDYISDCVKLGLDLTDKYTEFPKNIVEAHQRTQAQINFKKNKKSNDQIKAKLEDLKPYAWQDGDYLIRLAESVEDLISEGDMQHNCVARNYTANYASGDCIIMFVRRISDPDKSYITVEIKNDEIVQARIRGNKLPDDEGKVFLDKYEKTVLSAIKAKKIKNKKNKVKARVSA